MCPMISDDFSSVNSNFDPLEADKMYRFQISKIVDQENDPEWVAANPGKSPALIFHSEVIEGPRVGAEIQDWIYTKKKDGSRNKFGLGRIKAYAEAILGAEAANSAKGINTDDLNGGTFDGVMKAEPYTDQVTKESKQSIKLGKILRPS